MRAIARRRKPLVAGLPGDFGNAASVRARRREPGSPFVRSSQARRPDALAHRAGARPRRHHPRPERHRPRRRRRTSPRGCSRSTRMSVSPRPRGCSTRM
ncbi:hypothetical protein DC008_31180 [Streptomyces nigra]|nr:hypothetical protein DC008_31180 [Streptomyces nigra]